MKSAIKEQVRLRSRKLKDGAESLYLDYYHDGRRYTEYLKLYVSPKKDQESRRMNAETLRIANAIKSQRTLDLANNKAGLTCREAGQVPLCDFIQAFISRREKQGHCAPVYRYAAKYIDRSNIGRVKLADLNRRDCLEFIQELRKGGLKESSAKAYFNALSTMLNDAVRNDFLPSSPMLKLDIAEKPKSRDPERAFMSAVEVAALARTRCANEQVKAAFMFSCFTGLRISDIETLRWEDIKDGDGRKYISITMKKTGEPITVPVIAEAENWLPVKQGNGIVFRLPKRSNIWLNLKKWAALAGIEKNVSFHTARHTFATLLITSGADLYAVSKLLGHSDIKVTQIYAKLVDSRKVEAMEKLSRSMQGFGIG